MFFVYCLVIIGPTLSDFNKRLIPLSVIWLSGGQCTMINGHLNFEKEVNQINLQKSEVGFVDQHFKQ